MYGGRYGPDLEYVARYHHMSCHQVVAIHSQRDYQVYMLGFVPGFPYLGEMDERIATPRLAAPRVSIPAGSVGIAGGQTGVYPVESPGGWRLIGRTPVGLYDPFRQPPVLLRAGDTVRFIPVTEEDYLRLEGEQAAGTRQVDGTPPGESLPAFEVLEPGLLTTVQDLGRQGYQEFGMPVAGAMDRFALRVGNILVGNGEGEAGLELTLVGPVLKVLSDTYLAITGADLGVTLDGQAVPM